MGIRRELRVNKANKIENSAIDVSQLNVINASKGGNEISGHGIFHDAVPAVAHSTHAHAAFDVSTAKIDKQIVIDDDEVTNLLNLLAEQQGISTKLALKKAVVTAAYIRDLTAIQGGKLLVQRRDNSVGEIVLK